MALVHENRELIYFGYNLTLEEANTILRSIQSLFPELEECCPMNEAESIEIIGQLIRFALFSRARARALDEIILLSGIPQTVVQQVFQTCPWLESHLRALSTGEKIPPSLIPEDSLVDLSPLWQLIEKREHSIFRKIGLSFKKNLAR